MLNTLTEEKVFRDPIHGYIRVTESVVWQAIATREVQRMRRIKQLGSTSFGYHCGDHSRFSHSLGVYEIVRRMVSEVRDLKEGLTHYDKITVMLAGLLHDIGHAPFSHSFESVMKCSHEDYTIQIIKGESEINSVLRLYGENLADDVASVIDGTHPNKILCQLVSSQLDCDRMDYLLRDSYATGTKYGEFDLERILRTLVVCDGRIVVKESGMHTVEDYIMARYHMYWQVYYYSVSRSVDCLLLKLFTRLVDLYKQDKSIAEQLPMYKDFLENEVLTNDQYYQLDDATCLYSFHLMEKMSDPILSDLAGRLLNRNLFKSASIEKQEEIKEKLIKKGYDPRYYLYSDSLTQTAYRPYSLNDHHSIGILSHDGTIKELASFSRIVQAITKDGETKDERVFFPKEVNDD